MGRQAAVLLAPAVAVLGVSLAVPWLLCMFPLRPYLGFAVVQVQTAVDALPEDVRKYLIGSIFVTCPIALITALGGVAYKVYYATVDRVNHYLSKHCQVTMIFTSKDKHYDVVLDYIGSRCCVETGKILASTQPRSNPSFQERLAGWLGGKMNMPSLYYQPDIQSFASFFHWTDDEGTTHKIWLSRQIEKPQIRSDSGKGARDPETISLTMWWSTDSGVLKQFLTTALQTMLKEDSEGTVDIYVKHMWVTMWTKAISRERRDRDTIVLDEGLADYVVEDMRHFFTKTTADWYHNAGIPYRRGYLLYGPPGCGKTSFAQVLAGELRLDVCLMNLSNGEMNDDDLAELLRAAPARSMLLLEDVDAIFVERGAGTDKRGRGGGVSFSGLLNALDGAAAQEGCVIMLTTSHKDRLDEALIRPGRCDVHVHIEKASKDQAKRMFWRFFAKEATIRSASGAGVVTTAAAHGFRTGDAIMYKTCGDDDALISSGQKAESQTVFYARVDPTVPPHSQTRLELHRTAESALGGERAALADLAGGKGAKLQTLPEAGTRFATRIPDKQVSMAKLQGYLMKQKLLAEQEVKAKRGASPAEDSVEHNFGLQESMWALASETAVMNVHELLDVKPEAEDTQVTVYDHFRRVGVHHFAPLFEHFGVRFKRDLSEDLIERMGAWDPLLKGDGPRRDRLVQLLKGDKAIDAVYGLADLSILRDRFLSTFQGMPEAGAAGAANGATKNGTKAMPPLVLTRARSDPSGSNDAPPPPRKELLRSSSGVKDDQGLRLLEMAHAFQERLERHGKTDVSIWQLDMHFQRYEGDPVGALEHCSRLRLACEDRAPAEREAKWMTAFGFLRRLGLEAHVFSLEDNGFGLWVDFKHLSKDELKDKGGMSEADAVLCHAVLSGNKERADLLRKFQSPEFSDLVEFFRERFPEAPRSDARLFAVRLTDDAGFCAFSCLQVRAYLAVAAGRAAAFADIGLGLQPEAEARGALARPEKPPPPGEPDDWVHLWLKAEKLDGFSRAFLDQALSTREDVLRAPIDHDVLKGMGINKLGDRCKILRMIEAEGSA